MPEGQVIFVHRAGGAGLIRPVRRRPNIRFERGGGGEDAPSTLRRGDWVVYELSAATEGKTHRAINVRRAVHPRYDASGQDPTRRAEWDAIERNHAAYRQAVEQQWQRGELSPHQRAGLLVDAEYDRATRLTRGVRAVADSGRDVPARMADEPNGDRKEHVMNGQVRNTNERGYAFVRGEDGEDYFLHASQLQGIAFQELRQHDTVSFQPADGPAGKGPIAVNVERVRRAPGFADEVGLPEPNEPTPGQWPLATGRPADDEDSAYDWDQAG